MDGRSTVRGSAATTVVVFGQDNIWLKKVKFAPGHLSYFLHIQIPLFHLLFSRLGCDRQRTDSRESCPPTATGCDEKAMPATPSFDKAATSGFVLRRDGTPQSTDQEAFHR